MLRRIASQLHLASRGQRGNTMLQTVASLGALAILTATTGPMVERYLDHAKCLRTTGEVKIVASVLQLFLNDLGERGVPRSPSDIRLLTLLVSEGDIPGNTGAQNETFLLRDSDALAGRFNDYLLTNAPGFPAKASSGSAFGWDGPYLQAPLGSDPWGNRYAASVGLLGAGQDCIPVIVSAGADGVLETPYLLRLNQMGEEFGDDIYHSLR